MNKKSSWHFAILSILEKRKILRAIKRLVQIRFEKLIRVIRGPIRKTFFLKEHVPQEAKCFQGKERFG